MPENKQKDLIPTNKDRPLCNCYINKDGVRITEITDSTITFNAERVLQWADWIKDYIDYDRKQTKRSNTC